MSAEALEIARAEHRRVLAAEAKARPAREARNAAVVAAGRAGLKPTTIANATGIPFPSVRKILREAGVPGPRSTSRKES